MNKVTGTLRKRGKYWHMVIHYVVDGQRQTHGETTTILAVSDARTKRERDREEKQNKQMAERILQERIAEYESAYSLQADKIPYYKWVEQWLNKKDQLAEKGELQRSTVIIYRQQTEKHVVPYFKKKKITLAELRTKDINQFYQHVLTTGISPNTVAKKIHTYVKQSLDYAISEELIQFNPALGANLPKTVKKKITPYTMEETQEILELFKGTKVEVPVYMAAIFGLRRSEIIGLRWTSIDFKNRTLTVDNVSVYEGRKLIDKPNAKNETSNRILPLNDMAYNYLRSVRKKQRENRLRYGEKYKRYDHDYVCVEENGKRIEPDTVTRIFKNLIGKSALPKNTPHGLRHTCASLLLSAGAPLKDVQDWLGHADYNTTANIYGHIGMDRKRKLGDNLGKMLEDKSS